MPDWSVSEMFINRFIYVVDQNHHLFQTFKYENSTNIVRLIVFTSACLLKVQTGRRYPEPDILQVNHTSGRWLVVLADAITYDVAK